ncbi:Protein of unknown function, partial [Cotesia congregata]
NPSHNDTENRSSSSDISDNSDSDNGSCNEESNDRDHDNSDDPDTIISDNSDQYKLENSLKSLSFHSELTPLETTTSVSEVSAETRLPVINQALKLLNESSIAPRKLSDERFLYDKVIKISQTLKSTFGLEVNASTNLEDSDRDFSNLLEQLKKKFDHDETTRSEKIQILTLFPKEWSVRRISEFMNISRHLVNVAKNLLETKVLLSKPESKLGTLFGFF